MCKLICTPDGCTVVPEVPQKRLVQWHHTNLCHPGAMCTEETVVQHFAWENLWKTVKDACGGCPSCQLNICNKKKHACLPEKKDVETASWNALCLDLIGPHKIDLPNNEKLTLHCVTMIDPATGWFEIVEIPKKSADIVSNAVETMCLVDIHGLLRSY